MNTWCGSCVCPTPAHWSHPGSSRRHYWCVLSFSMRLLLRLTPVANTEVPVHLASWSAEGPWKEPKQTQGEHTNSTVKGATWLSCLSHPEVLTSAFSIRFVERTAIQLLSFSITVLNTKLGHFLHTSMAYSNLSTLSFLSKTCTSSAPSTIQESARLQQLGSLMSTFPFLVLDSLHCLALSEHS